MKHKTGFTLRTFCGEKIVVAEGLENINFNKMLSLNASAALLWEKFYGQEFEVEDVAAALVEAYGIDNELASKDAANLVESWKNAGVIEGFEPAPKPKPEPVAAEPEAEKKPAPEKCGFFAKIKKLFC